MPGSMERQTVAAGRPTGCCSHHQAPPAAPSTASRPSRNAVFRIRSTGPPPLHLLWIGPAMIIQGMTPPLHGTAPLPHLGVIRAAGADATSFLNGQLTNDFALLGAGQARLA